jgi:cell division protein ZapA
VKSIKVSILEKQYPLRVEESQEETMHQIAAYVDETIRQYKAELSKQPESTAMVLAALSIAEELFEERSRSRELNQQDNHVLEDVNASIEDFLAEIRP